MLPKIKVQDPVAEEMRRKDEKPTVSIGLARDLARERFGIAPPHFLDRFLFRIGRPATRVIPLNSYDDKNFLFYRRHMVKFYNGVESGHPAFIDAQARAMERVSSSGILTSVPRQCKDGKDVTYVDLERKDGGSEGGKRTTRHAMRVISFIPGKILGDIDLNEKNVASLLDQAGTLIGKVDACFQGFDHIGFHRNHFWDLKHSMKLADFVAYIGNDARKALVLEVLANFEKKVLPVAHELRESVIHNDANDQNILTNEKGTHVIGILDYGDMVKSWLVNEVAIAMAYVMLNKKYFLRDACFLLGGYCKEVALEPREFEVLRTLIACRLACSSTMSAYSASKDPDNEYLLLTQEPGWVALENFWRLSEKSAHEAFLTTALLSVPEEDQDDWIENFPSETGLRKPSNLGAYLERAQEG